MNAKKFLAMLVVILTMVLLVTGCGDKHEHEYADWTIQTPPTEQDSGVAIGNCSCGETKETTIPPLTDSEVWTKEVTSATHTSTGLEV